MARIINVSGDETKLEDLSPDALQKAVGGDIEVIKLPDRVQMLINEEGRKLGLPVNSTATLLCGRKVCGDVVLLNKEDLP